MQAGCRVPGFGPVAPRLRLTLPYGLDALYPLYPMSGAFPVFSSLISSLFVCTMGLGHCALVSYQGISAGRWAAGVKSITYAIKQG
ncbi:MAG: hypothetical protein WBF70_09850, partial [Aeromonas molluscorum]